MRKLNKEIMQDLRSQRGVKRWLCQYDCRAAYEKYKGRCALCGLALQSKSHYQNSAQFMLRVPASKGGKVHRDNLLAVCRSCKAEKPATRVPAEGRVCGFDSFADLIAQLVMAVMEKNETKIRFFSREVNDCVGEIMLTRYYHPMRDVNPVERVEGENTIPDVIVSMVKELSEAFTDISQTQTYVVTRKTESKTVKGDEGE